jgi:transposase
MITLPPALGIWLATTPTDMRKGFDGLSQVASQHVERNVLEGGLFVFLNRRRDRVKLLWWDEDGLAIFYKRLERGTFELPRVDPQAQSIVLTPTELSLVLGGIELASVRRRKRYRRPASRGDSAA